MTFKYAVTLAAAGGNKLPRFRAWAEATIPEIEYHLPPETPVKSEFLTIRLRSLDDRARLCASFPGTLP